MDLKEIDINIRNWVDLAQDRDYWRALVNAALNLQVCIILKAHPTQILGHMKSINQRSAHFGDNDNKEMWLTAPKGTKLHSL